MKVAKSSKLLFFTTRYLFVGMLIIFLGGILETGEYKITTGQILIFFALIGLQLIAYRLIYFAIVTKANIKLTSTLIIQWNNVSFLKRFGFFYFMRVRDSGKMVIFPISTIPFIYTEYVIKESDLDQIIQVMLKEYRINKQSEIS